MYYCLTHQLITTFSVFTHEYVDKSHNLALISAEQEARLLPVPSKASPVTASVCPVVIVKINIKITIKIMAIVSLALMIFEKTLFLKVIL